MRERRCYICLKCQPTLRVFLLPGETELPRCPEHGRMTREPNRPYRGVATYQLAEPMPPKKGRQTALPKSKQ
jgi:hypothetical protein